MHYRGTRMDEITQIEARIEVLMKEVGDALFPVTRERFIRDMLNVSDEIAEIQHIDMEWRRNNQEKMWLRNLEAMKREKDRNSPMWQKMRNWD